LTKVHGRSIAEAAMITGSSQGAIKQRAHRAYVTLRRLLGERERDATATAAGATPPEAAPPPRKEMA
jgi:DNA-directed RNA polymerase specialized sigma24 family protein